MIEEDGRSNSPTADDAINPLPDERLSNSSTSSGEYERKRDWVKEFSCPPRVTEKIKDRATELAPRTLEMWKRHLQERSLSLILQAIITSWVCLARRR